MGPIGCAFDTETTGLINIHKLPQDENQPDVVQFCAKLFDEHNIYATLDLLVVPDKEIEAKAESIHGISMAKVKAAGVPRRVMLSAFHHFIKQADFICAHNLNFDKRVIQTAYHRERIEVDTFTNKKGICTMLDTTPICQIPNPNYRPGRDKFKWPSLQEAYCHLVDPNGFSGAHDAQVDVDALIAVYRAIYYGSENKASNAGNSRNA